MIKLEPIGIIHTPILKKEDSPIQSARSDLHGTVEVFPEYEQGLQGIEDFSHLYLIYAFDRSTGPLSLMVKPFLDDQQRGLFTTRYPRRPNPIGLSVVRVVSREGNRILFQGADMLDETPLLDIKPYIADFDVFEVDKTGWYQQRTKK